MIIKDVNSEELYAIDLFEEWWHFLILGFSWFVPHKAYKMKRFEIGKSSKKTSKYGIYSGLAIGTGLILGDILRTVDRLRIPEEFHLIMSLLTLPLVIISMYTIWFLIKRKSIAFKNCDIENYIIVKIDFLSLNALIKCYWKLIIGIFFSYYISVNFRSGIITIMLLTPTLLIISCFYFIGVGKNAIIKSANNKTYMSLDLKKYQRAL
ncbi:MAG TPA: hypothetical protein VFH18_05865 [Erysipelotrichaceae bacterium]|nr:hypothetical protein [Erysipelotrichaceae bacterium]